VRAGTSNVHVRAKPDKESCKKWDRASKAQVVHLVNKWMKLMLLDRLHVDISFSTTSPEGDDAGVAARGLANDPYLTHWKLEFFPRFLDDNDAGREQYVVHELTHFLVGFLRENFRLLSIDRLVTWAEWKRTEETTVDHIANILTALSSR
jgi:hypothetical protein